MRPLKYNCAFGEWLRNEMIIRNISEKELSKALDIHNVTISYHLHGQRVPSFPMLRKYAEFLDTDVIYLYELTIKED